MPLVLLSCPSTPTERTRTSDDRWGTASARRGTNNREGGRVKVIRGLKQSRNKAARRPMDGLALTFHSHRGSEGRAPRNKNGRQSPHKGGPQKGGQDRPASSSLTRNRGGRSFFAGGTRKWRPRPEATHGEQLDACCSSSSDSVWH